MNDSSKNREKLKNERQRRMQELEAAELQQLHKAQFIGSADEKTRIILDLLDEPYFEIDLNGDMTYFNYAFYKLAGYTCHELIGLNNRDYTTPETAEAMYRIFNKIYETGKEARINDYEVIHKSGEIVHLQLSAYLLNDSTGIPVGFYGFCRDVSEKRRTELALIESENHNRAILNSIPDLVLHLDREGTILTQKGSVNEIYNDQLLKTGEKISSYLPDHISQKALSYINRALDTNRPFSYNYEIKSDEMPLYFESRIAVINENEAIAIVRDITDSKRTEIDLIESEMKFRVLADTTSAAIFIVQDNHYSYVNSAFEKMTGYKLRDLEDKNFYDIVHPSFAEIVKQRGIARQFGKNTESTYEFKFLTKNNETRWVEFSAAHIEYNKQPAMLGSAFDITDRKKAEMKILEQIEEIQAQNEELTASNKEFEAINEELISSQQELMISEEKFSRAFYSNPNPMAITTLEEGCFIDVNKSFVKTTGYSREENIGNTAFTLNYYVNPSDREIIYNSLIKTGKCRNYQISYRMKSGEIRLFNFSAEIIELNFSRCLLLIVNDITERKKAQEALALSEEKYRLVVENATEGIMIVQNEVIKYSNPAMAELLGYPTDEINNSHFVNYIHEEDKEMVLSRHRLRAQRKKIPSMYVFRIIHSSGSHKWMEVNVALCMWDNQEASLILVNDITDRKKAEVALLESEKKFSRAFYSNPYAMSISTLDEGKFLEVNNSFITQSGYSRDEIINKTSSELNFFINSEDRNSIKNQLLSCCKITNNEIILKPKSKDKRVCEFSADIIEIDGEKCLLSVVGDITEKKKTREEILKLNQELENRVQTRTIELEQSNRTLTESLKRLGETQDKLIQSEKMAALGALVAGVAHEINTPIGVGVTAASLLEEKTKKAKKLYDENSLKRKDFESYLGIAEETSSAILKNLIRSGELVKSFKQVAVDQSSEKQRNFNLKEYINEILTSLHPRFKKTSHTIESDIPADIEITSYPGAFSQIITNLIMNSLIHGFENIDNGKIFIKVIHHENTIELIYQDSGRGLEEEEKRKIYDPFFTTKRGEGGTGLGMHIVFNLVTQTLGGNIECESEKDNGVKFTIKIPETLKTEGSPAGN